jgi:hypothetical protein
MPYYIEMSKVAIKLVLNAFEYFFNKKIILALYFFYFNLFKTNFIHDYRNKNLWNERC